MWIVLLIIGVLIFPFPSLVKRFTLVFHNDSKTKCTNIYYKHASGKGQSTKSGRKNKKENIELRCMCSYMSHIIFLWIRPSPIGFLFNPLVIHIPTHKIKHLYRLDHVVCNRIYGRAREIILPFNQIRENSTCRKINKTDHIVGRDEWWLKWS